MVRDFSTFTLQMALVRVHKLEVHFDIKEPFYETYKRIV